MEIGTARWWNLDTKDTRKQGCSISRIIGSSGGGQWLLTLLKVRLIYEKKHRDYKMWEIGVRKCESTVDCNAWEE